MDFPCRRPTADLRVVGPCEAGAGYRGDQLPPDGHVLFEGAVQTPLEKPWGIHGDGKTHGKTMENTGKTKGKPWENRGKTMENTGKPWENHRKMVVSNGIVDEIYPLVVTVTVCELERSTTFHSQINYKWAVFHSYFDITIG